jgi:hypothetical protein
MRCDQARQLFDAYLDGELSPALATELGAHRIQCADCRRALALLEVSGHIVASDREPVQLSSGFSDRLLACMEPKSAWWVQRTRRFLYVGGPLAAAAVVALAFLGVFDRGSSDMVLSETEFASELFDNEASTDDQAEQALDELALRTRESIDAKRESGESLQQMLDLTVIQLLNELNEANEASTADGDLPPLEPPAQSPPPEAAPPADKNGDDL